MSTIIEKYLKEELSSVESEKVEAALIKEMFVQEQKSEWKKRIAQERQSPLNVIWRKPMLSSAIAAMLLLGIGLFLFQQQSTGSEVALVDVYLNQKFAEPDNYRAEKTSEVLWADAKEAYKNNQYDSAAVNIAQIKEKNEEQFFYWGLTLIYQKTPNYSLAAQAFGNARTKGNNYSHETTWYLALVHLKQNHQQQAKTELENIVATNGWNVAEAKKLLEAMK